jgi:hypothetical protein
MFGDFTPGEVWLATASVAFFAMVLVVVVIQLRAFVLDHGGVSSLDDEVGGEDHTGKGADLGGVRE